MLDGRSVRCILCEALLPFTDGTERRFERHMKDDHGMCSDQGKFFLAIHFMTDVERTEIYVKMESKIETAKKGPSIDCSGQNYKHRKIDVISEGKIQDASSFLDDDDDELECSYDGVYIAKKIAVQRVKDVLFGDAPIPRKVIQSSVVNSTNNSNIKTTDTSPDKSPNYRRRQKIRIRENNEGKISGRNRLKSCEFCAKEFNSASWQQEYAQHLEVCHKNFLVKKNNPVSNRLKITRTKDNRSDEMEINPCNKKPSLSSVDLLEPMKIIPIVQITETMEPIRIKCGPSVQLTESSPVICHQTSVTTQEDATCFVKMEEIIGEEDPLA